MSEEKIDVALVDVSFDARDCWQEIVRGLARIKGVEIVDILVSDGNNADECEIYEDFDSIEEFEEGMEEIDPKEVKEVKVEMNFNENEASLSMWIDNGDMVLWGDEDDKEVLGKQFKSILAKVKKGK